MENLIVKSISNEESATLELTRENSIDDELNSVSITFYNSKSVDVLLNAAQRIKNHLIEIGK